MHALTMMFTLHEATHFHRVREGHVTVATIFPDLSDKQTAFESPRRLENAVHPPF